MFALVIALILTTITALIPIENAFITFSSPQSAYYYNNTGNIKLIVNGTNTDLIVAAKGNTYFYNIVPKSNDGWKLGMGADTKRIVQTISDGISIYIYKYKNSNDYYITILNTKGGQLNISDNCASEFHSINQVNTALNKTLYTYYAYINKYDDQYSLTINSETIKLQS